MDLKIVNFFLDSTRDQWLAKEESSSRNRSSCIKTSFLGGIRIFIYLNSWVSRNIIPRPWHVFRCLRFLKVVLKWVTIGADMNWLNCSGQNVISGLVSFKYNNLIKVFYKMVHLNIDQLNLDVIWLYDHMELRLTWVLQNLHLIISLDNLPITQRSSFFWMCHFNG